MLELFSVILLCFLHQDDEALECGAQVWIIQEPGGLFGWYRYEAAIPLAPGQGGDNLVVEPEVVLPVSAVEYCCVMEGWYGKLVRRKQLIVWLLEL
jgi:hypothetical protein